MLCGVPQVQHRTSRTMSFLDDGGPVVTLPHNRSSKEKNLEVYPTQLFTVKGSSITNLIMLGTEKFKLKF